MCSFLLEWYLVWSHTTPFHLPHLPPLPTIDVQHPGITEGLIVLIHSPSDQQLGIMVSIVKAGGSMILSLCWPGVSLRSLQLGTLLRQVTTATCQIRIHQWHSQDEQVMWAQHGHTQCVRNSHLPGDLGHVPAMKHYTL